MVSVVPEIRVSIEWSHFSIRWVLQGLNKPFLKFRSFFSKSTILHIDMDFRVFWQTPISHLNCFRSLCKGPFVNLHQFSLVIYSHHLRPLAHSPPPPLSLRLCLFTWFLHVLLIQARFFHLHVFFTCFIQAPFFHLHGFYRVSNIAFQDFL